MDTDATSFRNSLPPPRRRRPDRSRRVRAQLPPPAAPPKLYRVGEIVEHTGVSRQTVHNYTTMGLITETRRTVGGHRLYDEEVFARLALIAELKRDKTSMREIRRRFGDLDANA